MEKTQMMSSTALVRTNTRPLNVPRSLRGHAFNTLTTLPAGKAVPIGMAPLLRQDAAVRGNVRCSFEMHETAELLMNAVNVNVMAYLVPWLAFERFVSLDEFNKSYKGVPYKDGDAVIDFIEVEAFGAHESNEIYTYMGAHADPAQDVNTMYQEAYNAVFNYRAKNRSPDLTLRAADDTTLAPAFWLHDGFKHIVPDFDQAKIDGEIALNVVNSDLLVKGIGVKAGASFTDGALTGIKETGGTTRDYANTEDSAAGNKFIFEEDPANPGYPLILAEMQANGITISLANIELAKKTQAFARMREQYTGLSEDHIIDLLMQGIEVPEQAWQQPMLLAQQKTIFGMSKRYSTSSGALDETAVNGATFVDLSIRTPVVPTGGVIVIIAEITPEQLFERQKDPFLFAQTVAEFPDSLRDELDPEKVDVIANNFVDTDHSTPNDTFGYGPLNFMWDYKQPRIGGEFYRPEVDASFDEKRQRIWAVETANPTLSTDFYLCTNMHTKPFADTVQDPFEVVMRGGLIIEGNTVFGHKLIEASNDYASVLAEAPQERIDKEA